jgi:glycosyltransferase involved in cell wall biosynthesis
MLGSFPGLSKLGRVAQRQLRTHAATIGDDADRPAGRIAPIEDHRPESVAHEVPKGDDTHIRGGRIVFSYEHEIRESGLNVYASADDYVHVGFRPGEGKIVLNTFAGGKWESESHAICKLKSGVYELDLGSVAGVTLNNGVSPIVEISFVGRTPLDLAQLHKIAMYGSIQVLTPGGGVSTEVLQPETVVQPQDGDFLPILRNQPPGLLAALRLFDMQAYVDLNPDLHGRFADRMDALRHFVEEGIAQLRPFDDAEIFDAGFYRARYEDAEDLSPAEAYEHWLSQGRPEGRAPSEKALLKRLGLTISEIPASFTAERYAKLLLHSGWTIAPDDAVQSASMRSGITFRTKWDAFEHWIGQIPATGALDSPLDESSASATIYKNLADTQVAQNRSDAAARLYWRSILLDPGRAQTWQHLGDVLLRSSDYAAAHHAYSQVIAHGAATYWTRCNLVQAEEGLGRLRAALNQAQIMLEEHPDRVEAHEILEGLVKKIFDSEIKRAKSLVLAGEREGAIAAVRSTFRDVCVSDESSEEAFVARAGALSTRTGKLRVLVLGTPHLRQCTFYRIEQKLEQLRLAGFEADFISQDEPQRFMSEAGACDAAIFYRVPAFPAIEKAILYCRQLGVVTFYEIDDLVYDPEYFPDAIENYRGQLKLEEYANLVVDAPLFERAMILCDYGIASTPALQRRMESVVVRKKCFLHRNAMDSRHERFVALRAQWNHARRTDEVILFYASGTRAHNEDFEILAAPAIAKLLRSRSHVRLVTMGYLPLPKVLQPYASRITQLPPVWDVNTFWSALSEADINLSVLKPGMISDCKSEIKWLEAAMLGIPSVVSGTATHRELLTDGRHAMLADSASEWCAKLELLIDSAETRAQIGRRAQELALSRYSLAAGAKNVEEIVNSVFGGRHRPPAKKPLILLVNVFFWPQLIGGATRVVRDNLECLQAIYGDEFEFQVFCAVEGARRPYEMRTSYYEGVRVTSVTHPMRAGMDWEPADEAMGGIFREYLALWQPALIHFHCIQRLSVCVAEAAQELNIPYVVTVHDGWWISDHQFLVDEKGIPVQPEKASAIHQLQVSAARATARIGRSLRVRAALAGAEQVLAVSEEFEKVYRAHGVTNICTVANGVSKLPPPNRKPSADGRVRLGYVGGISDHKGHRLIKRALQSTAFENLSLLAIDHSLGYREQRPIARWGTTPVQYVGKIPQGRVMELYDNLDVLLAPSIWPESFGLVAREALMSGLWVVASDRGAIGADVTPGVNGFVIDVSDTSELVRTLGVIDRNPARFRVPPLTKPVFRMADAQADELAALYRRILMLDQLHELGRSHQESAVV